MPGKHYWKQKRNWRKAEALKVDGERRCDNTAVSGRIWWEEVRDDLLNLIARRQEEIKELETAVLELEMRNEQ